MNKVLLFRLKCMTCCSLMLPLSLLAGQPRGKFGGTYAMQQTKKNLRIGPDQSYRKKLGSWERLMAKKLAPVQKARCAEAPSIQQYSGLPVDISYTQEHQATPCHFYGSGNAHPVLTFALLGLLLFAPHAYAVQLEQVPQDLAQHHSDLANRQVSSGFHCDGCFQPYADRIDVIAENCQQFEQKHETMARFALPAAIISLKMLFAATIGFEATRSWKGVSSGAWAGAIKGVIDETKGAVAYEVFEGLVDPIIQFGVELIAPKLMEWDSTLKQESAERLASWIAAGVLLNGYEFKHFAKYMHKVDFKALSKRAHLYNLARTKVTYSEFIQLPIKAVLYGTPGATTEILVRKALTALPNLDKSLDTMAASFMSDSTLEDTVSGNVFAQQDYLTDKYFSDDMPQEGVANKAFGQAHGEGKLEGTAYAPYIQQAAKFFQGDTQKSEFMGTAYEQPMNGAAQYFQTNVPRNEFGGNAFDQLANANTGLTFSELTPMLTKPIVFGTSGAATEILEGKSSTDSHDIPTSGNVFQQNIPMGSFVGNTFQQLVPNSGLYMQQNIPMSTSMGSTYVGGNAFQQIIANAGLYMQSNTQTGGSMGNPYGGNGYGNAYQQFMQNPGSSFGGGNSGGGVPGNAFAQMSNSASQYMGGSSSKR